MGLRPFGLPASTGGGTTGTPTANGVRIPVEDSDVLNNANANNNNSSNNNEDNSAAELRELEESKRFFSRFAPPVAHGANQLHNMVQYSHLGKTKFTFVFCVYLPGSFHILITLFFVFGNLGFVIFFMMVSICKAGQATLLKNVTKHET